MAGSAKGWSLAVVALGLTMPLALSLKPLAAHNPITTKVTWTREISALLERRCVSCHRPGGYAGFSLTTYNDARPWAVAMKEEVLAGSMPPWGAAPGVGHFANDRRLTRHEQELLAAWVDGGAPYSLDARTPAFATSPAIPNAQLPTPTAGTLDPLAGSAAIPLAPATITEAVERIASVTLQLPAGMTLTGWTFEPGIPFSVEEVNLELGRRWLGTWTPGEPWIEFPSDTGATLATAALFTARIEYRAPNAAAIDHSRLRIRMTKEDRPKALHEATVVRSWRAGHATELLAIRPEGDPRDVQVVARFPNGRADAVGVLTTPSHGPHPMYRLARPLSLPPGARIETTAAVRLLYTAGATRTVKPKVRRRPRR
jgi:hypothetical protein